ncbi:MAG: hypothetical protein K8S21_11990 [Gemmatimonadetes bacterium]|nr:hypothetical protein [Gemmatimonadota bacterium]
MTASEVRALIASAVLGKQPQATPTRGRGPDLGGFTLRPAQRRTLSEVRAAIAEFGGALLADPPGTGKTVLALAAARGAGRVLVLGPSTLRTQWRSAAERAAVPIVFVSHEALSRGGAQQAADLVIVDEAHHLRTVATRRYANAAVACLGAKVLLLSATPVVNRAADRDALLALFMGSRAERLTSAELGRCVVRRREVSEGRPTLRRLGPVVAHVAIDGIGEALRELPPPIPVAGGATATALVVMSLAMAWQSSLAALDAALRRRVQRGGALGDLLRAGLMPSHAALRHWVLHDDATQLALPLLVAPAPGIPAAATSRTMLAALERHLAAIRMLRDLIGPHRARDAAQRADAIRALLASRPGQRLVAFARHAETVHALHSALRGEPGVVAIVGARVRAASGRWSRDEVLRAIGPGARAHEAHDPRAIRLVLSTDALAEGVEMQGVGMVLHADLPWTPARLEQRVGRVVRVGSGAREVLETWFAAPPGARALVRLGARLARKARLRRLAVREGDARGEIVGILETWLATGPLPRERGHGRLESRRGPSATMLAGVDGFISVAYERDEAQLVCGVHDGTRWRVSSAPRRVLSVLRASDRCAPESAASLSPEGGPGTNGSPSAITARRVRRLLARVLARRLALDVTGATCGGVPRSSGARRFKRVRERLARLLERAPALVRPVVAQRHAEILRILALPLEAAREARIDDLLRRDPDDAAFARRLGALLKDRSAGAAAGAPARAARDTARATPLLLLRRASAPPAAPAAAPRAASPGSAATR